MGPPAPRLGGRRPRRRLCLPPPAEECPGPAFIFFLLLILGVDPRSLSPKPILGLGHRPVCFVFPCGRHVSRHCKPVAERVAHCKPLPADQTPHRLDAIRERCLNYRCQTVAVQTVVVQNRRLEFYLARTASLEAWPFGNTLMLLMKPPTAQGGSAFSFPHPGITKVGHGPSLVRRYCIPSPLRCRTLRSRKVTRQFA
jgi:hypothetical protein